MAYHQPRPRERPNGLPGTDRELAAAEGHFPDRPPRERRGEADSRAGTSRDRQAQGQPGHLFPGQHQLQPVHRTIPGRATRRHHRVGDGTENRRAQGAVVSHHRPAQGAWHGRWALVRGEEGRGAQHPLRQPWL